MADPETIAVVAGASIVLLGGSLMFCLMRLGRLQSRLIDLEVHVVRLGSTMVELENARWRAMDKKYQTKVEPADCEIPTLQTRVDEAQVDISVPGEGKADG